jgi:hypothetical protein
MEIITTVTGVNVIITTIIILGVVTLVMIAVETGRKVRL